MHITSNASCCNETSFVDYVNGIQIIEITFILAQKTCSLHLQNFIIIFVINCIIILKLNNLKTIFHIFKNIKFFLNR